MMIWFIPLLFLLSYFFLRFLWNNNNRVELEASIERISICTMDKDLIVPEVHVRYKYYYKDGVYHGDGFLVLSELLNNHDYEIHFNEHELAILEVDGKIITTEEHIEAYLLSLHDKVSIYIDPVEPFHSRIKKVANETISINI